MADSTGCVVLELAKMEDFLNTSASFKERSHNITTTLQSISNSLFSEWKGEGADAFREYSEGLTSDLTGVEEILAMMCDTLHDCLEVFTRMDHAVGEMNQGNKATFK